MPIPAGVAVGFGEPLYTVRESESTLTICAVITGGEAAVPVEVSLMTGSDGNAQGLLGVCLLHGWLQMHDLTQYLQLMMTLFLCNLLLSSSLEQMVKNVPLSPF